MEQSELLIRLAKSLEAIGVEYLVTGGMASATFGEPRFTNDIDVIADLHDGDVAAFCAAFPQPEFYVSEESIRQAIRDRFQFNVLQPTSGLKIDVILPQDTEFERSRRQRMVRISVFPEVAVCFASPEDVIIRKMEYYAEGGSEKHLRDIAGILKVQADKIDRAYIVAWATRLGVADIWRVVEKRVGNISS
jgi:hypothetical protein